MENYKLIKIGYKVKAIDSCEMEDSLEKTLTIGKYYEIITITPDKFEIIDDEGDIHRFSPHDACFEGLDLQTIQTIENDMKGLKQRVLNCISDSVSMILYYDRQEDDELPVGAIDTLVMSGQLTIDEMVDMFKTELEKGICLN